MVSNNLRTIIEQVLAKEYLTKEDIIRLLSTKNPAERNKIYKKAYEIKKQYVDNKVYLRGLIEFSNICRKNCLYCGIRSENTKIHKYQLNDKEIFDAVIYAWKNNYGSIVLQSGERNNSSFVDYVDYLLKEIKQITNQEIGITLSCGEQTEETYRRWYESGAHRYLLRIETSDKNLYNKIHPDNDNHSFDKRLEALINLQQIGYQTGTGVMIGLPFQTTEHLTKDLLFFKNFDIDMVGMGPYIEHNDTPLYKYHHLLMSKKERLDLSLCMIAVLRIMMPDINIVSTTALHTIEPEKKHGLNAGANVFMPELTPVKYKKDYLLYEDKFCLSERAKDINEYLKSDDYEIGYGEWGDSKHYFRRILNNTYLKKVG